MKKKILQGLAILSAITMVSGCQGTKPKESASESSKTASVVASDSLDTSMEASKDTSVSASSVAEVKASFVLDFEKKEYLVGPTVNFDAAFTPGHIKFEPETGFTGNAYQGIVAAQTQGGTWWVSGVAMDKKGSNDTGFKDIKKITFKYKSTVAYTESPFVFQLVWKDKTTGDTVATIEEEFPMEKTDEIKTFSIDVLEDITKDLNDASNYYLDWMMVGLKENANDDFKPGKFFIDDVSFWK